MPAHLVNVLSILFAYIMQILNGLTSLLCLPFMFVLLVAPLPPPLAHAVVTLLWATASVSSQLSIALILLKVLLVTHFEWVFALNPETVGRRLFRLAALVGLLPSFGMYLAEGLNGSGAATGLAFLTARPRVDARVPAVILCALAWFCLYAVTLIFSMIFVPIYSQRMLLRSAALRAGELQPEEWRAFASLKQLAIGGLLFATVLAMTLYSNYVSSGDPTDHAQALPPPQVLFAPLLLNLTLLYCLTDHNVVAFIRRVVHKHRQLQWLRQSRPEVASVPEVASRTEVASRQEVAIHPEVASVPEVASRPEVSGRPEVASVQPRSGCRVWPESEGENLETLHGISITRHNKLCAIGIN